MSTVFISGAGRGIGLALTESYLKRGDTVIATYRSETALEALRALPNQASLQCYPLEVTDARSIHELVEAIAEQPIDTLINNAGVFGGERQSLNALNFADWQETLAINTLAPIQLSIALLPNVRKSENGKIIAISSMMGSLERNQPGFYAYRSSKAALNKAMQCLAHDLRDEKIIVIPMHPGWVQTDMGGAQADITVEECVTNMVPTVDNFSMADSGKFWQYNGEPMTW